MVYRRCGRCGRTVQDSRAKRCPHCGGERVSWAYKVDVAALGAKRVPQSKSGFTTKREALEAMARLQTGRLDGTYVEPSKLTLGAYLDDWLAGGPTRGWRGNTARDYRVGVGHIKLKLADVPLQALTFAQIEGLYGYLLTQGKRSRRDGDDSRSGLARKTVANVHICLRAALNDAVQTDPPVLRRNPAIGAFTYSRTKDRVEMLTWSVEEVQGFLAFTVEDRDHGLYRTALMTGMRRGELLGLRRRDLDLNAVVDGEPRPRLRVRQQWTKDGDAGLRILILKTGTKAWRTIDLDPVTADALREHVAAQEFERRSWGAAYGRGCPHCAKRIDGRCPTCGLEPIDLDLVFPLSDGMPHDPDVITGRFERRAEECPGVQRIRFHDQRHTHATLLLETGESLKCVAERLGDREDTVLETYGHVTARMRIGAVSRLAALLEPQGTVPSVSGQAAGRP
jgi:integrase